MYQGKQHVWEDKFNKVSDLMERWYVNPAEKGPRKGNEYRGALRNAARIAYRIAKRTMRDMKKS